MSSVAVVFVTPVALTLYVVGILALIIFAAIVAYRLGFRHGIHRRTEITTRIEQRAARRHYQRAFDNETTKYHSASDWLPGWDDIGATTKSITDMPTQRMPKITPDERH